MKQFLGRNKRRNENKKYGSDDHSTIELLIPKKDVQVTGEVVVAHLWYLEAVAKETDNKVGFGYGHGIGGHHQDEETVETSPETVGGQVDKVSPIRSWHSS